MATGLACWIVVGLLASFIAGSVARSRRGDPSVILLLGVLGSVAGGLLFGSFTAAGVSVFDTRGLLAAAAGAVAALTIWRGVRDHIARG